MSFYSTRGGDCVTASQAILKGLALDGGLYVPSLYPNFSLDKIISFVGMSYQEIANHVLRYYLEDYSIAELNQAIRGAYDTDWDDAEITPVKTINNEGIHVLELFHGPTLAFKDVALKMLPHLMGMAAKKNQEEREVAILVATSGDTGKAALEGFRDVKGTSCSVFYPKQGVSAVQELQMNTTAGSNTHVIGIEGNFDDAQRCVKRLFADEAFREKLSAAGKVPSSANSINFGRLAPQIVYYFYVYSRLIKSNQIRAGQKVVFCVPTGNFGDILAGYYAYQMGLPVERFICASNRNNVLSDFFRTGTYYTHRAFFKTMSPSMDILVSSNLERLLYDYADRDPAIIRGWMETLKTSGSFCIGDSRVKELSKLFWAESADDFETAQEINLVWERSHYLMDPHTAVGSRVLRKYRQQTGDHTHSVILSTASPYKFSQDVYASLCGRDAAEGKDFFTCAKQLEKLTGVPIPKQVRELQSLPVLHQTVASIDGMEEALLNALR